MELAKSEPRENVSHHITLKIVDQVNQTSFSLINLLSKCTHMHFPLISIITVIMLSSELPNRYIFVFETSFS